MACRERWLDVFVTKPDTGLDKQSYEYDDQFACTVQSVRIEPDGDEAVVVDNATDWILPTWSETYNDASFKGGVYDKIEVGDLVRIGVTGTNGHTDYLTVLEKRTITKLWSGVRKLVSGNETNTAIPTQSAPDAALSTAVGDTPETLSTAGFIGDRHSGISFTALRLNQSINCTAMPTNYPIDAQWKTAYNSDGTHPNQVTIETRNQASLPAWPGAVMSNVATIVREPTSWTESVAGGGYDVASLLGFVDVTVGMRVDGMGITAGTVAGVATAVREDGQTLTVVTISATMSAGSGDELTFSDPSPHRETDFYPLYVHKKWLAGPTLRAALDHGVKQCSCIKLVGYSVANKRQVGLHHAHEMQADDYLVLRINEIEGHVVSNNRFANGAFAVLYSGSSADNQVGAVEYSQFDTVNGVVVQNLDATNSVLRNLTLEITDRMGNPAHFGRMHLWFKLLVTHG